MSHQAGVYLSPVRAVLYRLLNVWGYKPMIYFHLDCAQGGVEVIEEATVNWDGTNLSISASYNPSCTGTITSIRFELNEANYNFFGIADIKNISIQVEYGKTYKVYYTEVANIPLFASVTGP